MQSERVYFINPKGRTAREFSETVAVNSLFQQADELREALKACHNPEQEKLMDEIERDLRVCREAGTLAEHWTELDQRMDDLHQAITQGSSSEPAASAEKQRMACKKSVSSVQG